MSLLEQVKLFRRDVVQEDLKTFKNCGRNKCLKLLNAVILLNNKINFHPNCEIDGFYGNEKGFLNIHNINSLVSYCDKIQPL